jgi:hypothetical protein
MLSQLDKIAGQLAVAQQKEDKQQFFPELQGQNITTLKAGGDEKDGVDSKIATKAVTVSAFGVSTAAPGTAGSEDSGETVDFSDAFHIRVLNLVDNICRLREGLVHGVLLLPFLPRPT